MLAFGLTLLVSVAAAPPPAVHAGADKVASTYEDASCDAGDGGECADEVLIDLPPPAAILDCANPFIAEMIGSCDLPTPTIPSLHLPTLRNGGNGFVVAARDGSTERLTIVTPPTSVDAALVLRPATLAPSLHPTRFIALASTITQYAPLTRLDRPPRA
jgi:hypothetical protein